MIPTPTPSLHYRAVFDLKPTSGSPLNWAEIVRRIRGWVVEKANTDQGLIGQWFFKGGQWSLVSNGRFSVVVEREIGSGADSAPQFWSVSLTEPCGDIGARQWRTDMGLTVFGNERIRVSVTTVFWILPGFIGEEPPAPVPSSPRVVRYLLGLPGWQAWSGTERLLLEGEPLKAGKAKEFLERLRDTERRCPIVYVSREAGTEQCLVPPADLARALAGMASVYMAESSGLDQEMEWFLPKEFRCGNGMIRVYQPGVRVEVPSNFKRHRYFSRRDVNDRGVPFVTEAIVRGVARLGWSTYQDAVGSPGDVRQRTSEARLSTLRGSAKSAEEYKQLLEIQEEIYRQIVTEKQNAESQVASLQAQLANLEREIQEGEDEASRLRFQHGQAKSQGEQAQAHLARYQELFEGFDKLPSSLLEVVEAIGRVHGGRLVFTESAKRAASKAEFQDVHEAWRCLWACAQTLPDLFFGEAAEIADKVGEFKRRTTLELAMCESKATQGNPKLMRLRKRSWNERPIDITPHVKAEKGGRYLRVYFCPIPDLKLIVVDHCGDHLDTAGTRKMS